MAKDQPEYENKDNGGLRNSNGLVVAETLRSVGVCKNEAEAKPAAKSEEKISVFWRVFGGTLLSIGALIVMTAYGGLSSSITELRKEINQEIEKRAEYARKDDVTRGLTSLWSVIKEVQSATGALGTVNDRVKVIDQQLERTVKNLDGDRKEVLRKIEEQRKVGSDEKVELTRQLEEQRKTLEGKFQEVQRKLDDQRRAFDEERKDLQRRFDDQRKTFDDERRDLLNRMQTVSERLATVEGRTSMLGSTKKAKTTPTTGN